MDMRSQVLLSITRALWHANSHDLLGVAASCDDEVHARFLYEGPVGEKQTQCTSMAETYCIADFAEGVSVRFEPVADADLDLLEGEFWAYLRHEP